MVKRVALTICIGLVIGAVLPLALMLILGVADIIVINIAYSYFQASVGLTIIWLSILLIPLEITSLFFLARFNKTLTAAALPTAIIMTLYVIYAMTTLTPVAPD